MEAYVIVNKYGEFLLWTASHTAFVAKEKLVTLKKQDWADLEKEDYRVHKVEIRIVIE